MPFVTRPLRSIRPELPALPRPARRRPAASQAVPIAIALGLSLAACGAGRGAVPSHAKVEILQTDTLVMRGTAPAVLASAACSEEPPAAHHLELTAATNGQLVLREAMGEGPLAVAVLHVTHLDSQKTWCVAGQPDGHPAVIPAVFPSGVYAIGVAGSKDAGPQRYELRFEKL
jgi:hypothetical protein